MKFFVSLLCILILALGYLCYDSYGTNVPIRTTLSHIDGRSMDVVILSRGMEQVTFQRESDGLRFSCDIRDLSLLSKCRVYWYFRATTSTSSAVGAESSVIKDVYLKELHEEMKDLREELNLSEYRYNAAETEGQRRAIENQIEALRLRVNKLKLEQAEYLSPRK
jgi:hypothetical protein